MLQVSNRIAQFRKLFYVLPAALTILVLACSSGSSSAISESNESIASDAGNTEQAASASGIGETSSSPDSATNTAVENAILSSDVLQLLGRNGVRPEGIQPSILATLANSA